MGKDRRPVYGMGQVPDDLATVTMLRRRRRKPAPDQKPVATLRYLGGKESTDLYRVADSIPMRPLTDKQKAAAERGRAYPRCCDVCGWDAGEPLQPIGDDQLHRCPPCRVELHHDQMRKVRVADRARAAAWAAEVIADPTSVVLETRSIDLRSSTGFRTVKRAAVAELVAVSLANPADRLHITLIPHRPPKRKRDLPADGRPIGDVAPGIADWLAGRRIVAWSEWDVDGLSGDLVEAGVVGRPGDNRLLYMPSFLSMRDLYATWCGHIRAIGWGYVEQPRPPGGPAEVVDWIVATLPRMAAAPTRGAAEGPTR